MDSDAAPTRNGHSLRILIVEDEALVAFEMENVLADAGYDIVGIADDREGALEAVDRAAPDLALVDVQLANRSSGLDVAAELNRQGIRCLFVTGNCPADRGRAHSVGCLHKPFTGRILVEAVSVADNLMRGVRPKQLPWGMHLY